MSQNPSLYTGTYIHYNIRLNTGKDLLMTEKTNITLKFLTTDIHLTTFGGAFGTFLVKSAVHRCINGQVCQQSGHKRA